MRLGAEDERVIANGRAGHEAGGELIFGEPLEIRTGLNDGGFAFLAKKVNTPIGGDGRSGIVAANSLTPNFLTSFGRDTRGKPPLVINHVNVILDEKQRRFFGHTASCKTPCDFGLFRTIFLIGFHSQQLTLAKTSGKKTEVMAEYGTGTCAVLLPLNHAPQFLPRGGLIGVVRHRTLTEENGFTIELNNVGSAVRLAQVAAALGLSVGIEILIIYGTFREPHITAVIFIERKNILLIGSIVVVDQQVAPKNGRGTGTAEMITNEIASSPQHLKGFGVDTRNAGGTPSDVHSARFYDGSR